MNSKNQAEKIRKADDLARLRKLGEASLHPQKPKISVGMATCGLATGAERVYRALLDAVEKGSEDVVVTRTGCMGFCQKEPIVTVRVPGRGSLVFKEAIPELVPEILGVAKGDQPRRESILCVLEGEFGGNGLPGYGELGFFSKQEKIVLKNCGFIDPEDISEYVATGGYQALFKVLTSMKPEEVVALVKDSGLRGRGGAGFPTGLKWEVAASQESDEKFIVCNADEGDPGAYMDRSILEGDPHKVLEGMVIGAFAMGAHQGFIYARDEYPEAIRKLEKAIQDATELGLLGRDLLGTGFNFTVRLVRGGGAFVCGEETALMASIEGRPGEPRQRPPFPAQAGLWGKPTNINNVETWANVPEIITQGPGQLSSLGTGSSKGTKVFSLVGKVENTGLIEVPMGLTLREIVFDIGGGVPRGKKFKAIQTGGPSGGCLPEKLLDMPVDYEQLTKAGTIMGSGGMIVMDEDTCMVDVARYFLDFLKEESCGKCTPCREGIGHMLTILNNICSGRGKPEDLAVLEEVAKAVKDFSLCGLGQTAPNPVLATLRYFRDEYEEHINRRHCRAAVCKDLVRSPCSHTCPAGVEVHRYVRAIGQGNFEEAYQVIREKLPLPSVCGLVCYHPCEERCRRGDLDQPVAIQALKRAAVQYGSQAEEEKPQKAPSSGKRVAVVGSGPAGLTAAYYLSKKGGHEVTVFEAQDEIGGMLRLGIPRYRLPQKDLERDLEIVRRASVKFVTKARVESVKTLKRDGFDAIFLSPGAHRSVPLGADGAECREVLDCLEFLRNQATGGKAEVGSRVAVVGGGNSAIDAARTARRLGAREVAILYRRSREEMPAKDHEVNDAMEEGIGLEFLCVPVKIKSTKSGIEVTCQKMELGEVDQSGRRRPVPVPGSEFTRSFDTLITAIGQRPDVPSGFGVELGAGEAIQADPDSLETSVKGVFAGGDAVTGPASVIEAIAHGRRAATAIDEYLGGNGDIDEHFAPVERLGDLPPLATETEERYRPEMPREAVRKRTESFGPVELGYSREAAIEEANRCLRCDLEGQS